LWLTKPQTRSRLQEKHLHLADVLSRETLPPGRAGAPTCAGGLQPDPRRSSNPKPHPASAASRAGTVGAAGTQGWGWGGRLSPCLAQQPRGANTSWRKAMQEGAACNPGDVTSAGDTTRVPEQPAQPLPSRASAAAGPRRRKPTWKSPSLSQLPSQSSVGGRTDASPAPPTAGSCSRGFGTCYKNYPGLHG